MGLISESLGDDSRRDRKCRGVGGVLKRVKLAAGLALEGRYQVFTYT